MGRYQTSRMPAGFDLKMNMYNRVPNQDFGKLIEKDDALTCEGETLKNGNQWHSDMLQMSEYQVLLREEKYAILGDEIESTSDHVTLPCKPDDRGCLTGEKTYVWNVDKIDCDLEILQSFTPNVVLDTYYLDRDKEILINVTGTRSYAHCPMQLKETNYPDIFLADTKGVSSLRRVKAVDVDIMKNTNMRLDFLGYELERSQRQQLDNMRTEICRRQTWTEEEPIQIADNLYGLRKGDTYLEFECVKKIANIKEDKHCWKKQQ